MKEYSPWPDSFFRNAFGPRFGSFLSFLLYIKEHPDCTVYQIQRDAPHSHFKWLMKNKAFLVEHEFIKERRVQGGGQSSRIELSVTEKALKLLTIMNVETLKDKKEEDLREVEGQFTRMKVPVEGGGENAK